jgi:hypothetical protein
MRILCLVLCCFGISCVTAQNFKQDFLEVYTGHKNRAYYTQKITVTSYNKEGDKTPINKEEGDIIKGKKMYYSNFAGQETILDGEIFIYVNHKEHKITYYDKVNLDVDELAQVYQQGLDSMYQDRISYLGASGKHKTYRIDSPKEMIKTTEVKLNMETKMVEQLVYFYQKVDRYESTIYKTVIDYRLVSTKEPRKESFNWEKYITIKNKEAVLNKAYRQFDLTQRKGNEIDRNQLPH